MPSVPAAVVGIKHRASVFGPEVLDAVRRMKLGDHVRLVREPDNAYDSNAVQVWYLSVWVGYIPKVANPKIAAAMDAGISPKAVVEITPMLRRNWIYREPRLLISW